MIVKYKNQKKKYRYQNIILSIGGFLNIYDKVLRKTLKHNLEVSMLKPNERIQIKINRVYS